MVGSVRRGLPGCRRTTGTGEIYHARSRGRTRAAGKAVSGSGGLVVPLLDQLHKTGIVTKRLEIGIMLDPVTAGKTYTCRTLKVLYRVVLFAFQRQQAGNVVADTGVFRIDRRGLSGPRESSGPFA